MNTHLTNRRRTVVSVAMASYNRVDCTINCLSKLYSQKDADIDLKVYLLDDASSDGTAEKVRNLYPEVVLLSGDGMRFWGGGMYDASLAILQSEFDFMLWLNDDAVLYPQAIKILLESYDMASMASAAVSHIIVGAFVSPGTQSYTYSGLRRENSWHPARVARVEPSVGKPTAVDTMNGNCVLIPVAVVEKIGLIDPAFTQQLGDIDYGYRAKEAGIDIWVAPDPVGEAAHPIRVRRWETRNGSLRIRLRYLLSPHGWPPRPWVKFMWRHGGVIGVLALGLTYAKAIGLSLLPRQAK